MHRTNNDKWLKTSFGPYHERLVLNPISGTQHREMESLRFLRKTRANVFEKEIGLDDTEYITCAPSDKVDGAIFFIGVIYIDKHNSRAMLTERGRELLDRDVRRRYIDKHTSPNGTLTLRDVLQADGTVGVKIYCEKSQTTSATYVREDGIVNISSTVPGSKFPQQWKALSLHWISYEHSRNFLDRYALLQLLEKIFKHPEFRDTVADEANRTPEFFIQAFIDEFSAPASNRCKIVYISDDDDVDSDGNTDLPVQPRHLSHAEARGRFLSQSDWLIADQMEKVPNKRVIDLIAWYDWFEEMQQERRAIWMESKVKWGWRHGLSPERFEELLNRDGMTDSDVAEFGVGPKGQNFSQELAKLRREKEKKERQGIARQLTRPRPAATNAQGQHTPLPDLRSPPPAPSPRRRRGRPRKNVIESSPEPEGSHTIDVGSDTVVTRRKPLARVQSLARPNYDPDYSDSDSSSCESDTPDHKDKPRLNEPLMAMIPAPILHGPVMPDVGMVWHCPVTTEDPEAGTLECPFKIDFVNITEEKLLQRGCLLRTAKYVAGRRWKQFTSKDTILQDAFEVMSYGHFCLHLKHLGIVMIERPNQPPIFEFRQPRAHAPFPLVDAKWAEGKNKNKKKPEILTDLFAVELELKPER